MRIFRLASARLLLAVFSCCGIALGVPGSAAAAALFDSSLGAYTNVVSETRSSGDNYGAVLQFTSNVAVSQIGVFTSVDDAQDIKFLIFDSLLNVGGTGTLLYSNQKSFAQDLTQTFIYSDPIPGNFTFLAGKIYDVGILGSGTNLTGKWGDPETYTQSGITELAANANLSDFVTPATTIYTSVVPFVQLLAPIPEPETYAMMLAGLGLMGFVARRRKRQAGA